MATAAADDADAATATAAVVGASGFAGGELLRLLAGHPEFAVAQATSREYANKTVGSVHPNLRGLDLRFTQPTDLESVDVLFAAAPHGVAMEHVDAWQDAADTVVDLSADFRLGTEAQYDEWYDGHTAPDNLDDSVYALPEISRDELAGADLIAGGGCNATATILGLLPLHEAGLLEDAHVVVDVKVGSSEGGASGGKASSHAERSGVVRPYAPQATVTRPRSSRNSASRCRSRPTPSTWCVGPRRRATCSPRRRPRRATSGAPTARRTTTSRSWRRSPAGAVSTATPNRRSSPARTTRRSVSNWTKRTAAWSRSRPSTTW